MAWVIISKIILFWYASASRQGFSICFPIAACKQALVSPYRGVAWTRKERLPSPLSFFHLTTQPVSPRLHLVRVAGQPRLFGFQQVSLSRAGRGVLCVHLQIIWKHEVLKNAPSEYVLLEGFCPFPVWIEKICSMAKWPPVCQRRHPSPRPGACDKCLHFWLSTDSYGKNYPFIWTTCIK